MTDRNFIFQATIEDLALCDDIIAYFESNPLKGPGIVGAKNRKNGVYAPATNTKIKESTDALLLDQDLYTRYTNQLKKVTDQYVEQFPCANSYAPWGIFESINIQRYLPGEGYHSWHTERTNNLPVTSARHLVFMTYLNTVTDQGGTEFLHQELITPARQGLTVVWPADWTYTHRGQVSPTQTKYIVTGWYSYNERQ